LSKLSLVVSRIKQENDYQIEQASAAEEAARRLGVDVQVIFADKRQYSAKPADPEGHSIRFRTAQWDHR